VSTEGLQQYVEKGKETAPAFAGGRELLYNRDGERGMGRLVARFSKKPWARRTPLSGKKKNSCSAHASNQREMGPSDRKKRMKNCSVPKGGKKISPLSAAHGGTPYRPKKKTRKTTETADCEPAGLHQLPLRNAQEKKGKGSALQHFIK